MSAILLVDDHDLILSSLCSLLKAFFSDYEIVTADSYERLDAVLHENSTFELMILDYNMPHMTPSDAVDKYLKETKERGIKLVLMSGQIHSNEISYYKRLGVQDVLLKANSIPDNLSIIQSLLEHNNETQPPHHSNS